jgi:hypothetical protein
MERQHHGGVAKYHDDGQEQKEEKTT